MTSQGELADTATHALIAAPLAERLASIDLERALALYPTAEALAARMLEALPDVVISDPPIGPCYSAPALSRWKQLTRQAIDQQRRAGRLFGVKVDRRWLYPSTQFDRRGRRSSAFAALLSSEGSHADDPVGFAVWLGTPDPETHISPRVKLQDTPDTRSPEEKFLDGFVPTIIDPPQRAARKTGTSRIGRRHDGVS